MRLWSTASPRTPLILTDGRRVHIFVEHAIGSLQNPMTTSLLEGKFHGLSDPILGEAQTNELIKACWSVGQAVDVKNIIKLATPKKQTI